MDIQLLYFEGCPHWQTALENLRTALQQAKLEWPVELVKVEDDETASRLKFLGSPSIHVNGTDLWPEERQQYSLSCRLYHTPEGPKGSPSVSMLRQAFQHLESD